MARQPKQKAPLTETSMRSKEIYTGSEHTDKCRKVLRSKDGDKLEKKI